jgi:hypothetical protein
MKIPREFERFAQRFFQGSEHGMATPEQWVDSALKGLDVAQRRVVQEFVSELLDGNYSDSDLQEAWNATSADYYISPGGTRTFFAIIRDRMRAARAL